MMLVYLLLACPTDLDPVARAMPLCPEEAEFQDLRVRLACHWAEDCGLGQLQGRDLCVAQADDPVLDAQLWQECGATYNPCRAGECLAIWRQNPVDCSVSFYSGCEWGDWYDGAEDCETFLD